jgi:hypothetical protein
MHFLEGVAWEELETTSKPLPTAKLIAMRNLLPVFRLEVPSRLCSTHNIVDYGLFRP